MNTIQTTEYAVHLLQQTANGTKRWKAVVETLPPVMAEGESCEAVLEDIGRKLQMTLANGESAAAPNAPAALKVFDRQEAILRQVASGCWPEEPDIPEAPIASSVKEFLL